MFLSRHRQWIYILYLLLSPLDTNTNDPSPYDYKPTHGAGIVFNRLRTVILADRYEYVQFVLPSPRLHVRFAQEISNITDTLQRYWIEIPGDCPELRTRAVPDTETAQLLNATRATFEEAQDDIRRLKEDLQQLLQAPPQHRRSRRYAHLLAAAAGAGLLTIGAQLATGCVAGVLGPCPNEHNIAANRQQIQTAIANIEASNQHWAQVQSETNEQIFVLNKNVDQLAANQRTLQQNQQDLWSATQDTLNGLAQGLRTMQICTEYLFTRTQLNLLRNTLSSRLQLVHSSLQAFRAALWSYQATVLDAIPGLAVGLLPMSLVSRTTLLQILDAVHSKLARSDAHSDTSPDTRQPSTIL